MDQISYQNIIENLTNAVIILDKTFKVRFINSSAEVLFDISQRQAELIPLQAILPGEDNLFKSLLKVMETGHSSLQREIKLYIPTTGEINVDCAIKLLELESNKNFILLEFFQLDTADTIARVIGNLRMTPKKDLGFSIIYNSNDITNNLYSEEIGLEASNISKNEDIRNVLLSIKHACVKAPGLIANGRDMGTKVFPEAMLKIYFTASIDIRAKRRYEQLIKSGFIPNLVNIQKSLKERDEKDINREVSPLKAAKDAIIIDSSELNIDTILDKILGLYKISRV